MVLSVVDTGLSASSQVASMTATPVAGDVVVFCVSSSRATPRNVVSVAGMGASWVPLLNIPGNRASWWLGTNPTTSGNVSATFDGGTAIPAAASWLIRGLGAATVQAMATAVAESAATLAGPSHAASTGQVVLAFGRGASNPVTFPLAPAPAAGWIDNTGSPGSARAAYRLPATTEAHHVNASCAIAGVMVVSQLVLGPAPVPNPPTGLTQTASTPTTATVAWTAPATGVAPTSYEVRVDAGAWVDVGAVTSYVVAGLLPSSTHTVEVRSVAPAGVSAPAGPVGVSTAAPYAFRPWLVSERLLATAGADPTADQPAFQWHNHAAGALYPTDLDLLRSRSLMGWQITTGRPGPRDKVPPTVATVQLAAWGEYADAGLPELGQRFRLALSPLLTALGIAAGDLPRFTGEVTDVDLDPATRVLTVTGVGRYARQSRQVVDGTSWPVEREGARVARILDTLAGGVAVGLLDAGRVDLIAHPASGPVSQLVDAVSDSTTGQLVERRDGALDWHSADRRRDAPTVLTLDAGELLRGFRWSQRVGDLTNVARLSYAAGEVYVEDSDSVVTRGDYPTTLDTLLTHPSAAQAIGGLIVGRYGRPVWLLPAVLLDLTRTLDPAELPAGVGLAHGAKVQLTGLPSGGPYTDRGAYVEGVVETLTPRAWRLTLTVADEQLSGSPLRWRDVPDAVSWADVTPALRWLDVATIQDPADLT